MQINRAAAAAYSGAHHRQIQMNKLVQLSHLRTHAFDLSTAFSNHTAAYIHRDCVKKCMQIVSLQMDG